ncbi:hypothetical protein KQX66_01165 [Paenibacillus sp. SM 69]|nr:hypothetical protein [Paenibacillus oleatilyticus]
MKYFRSAEEIAKQIQTKIMLATGVWSRAGISENKVLAKQACDNFANKHSEGIFVLPQAEGSRHPWPLPISQMFGVGRRMTNHFFENGHLYDRRPCSNPITQIQNRF